MKFCLVVYSHTDYNDILQVQNDCVRNYFTDLHKVLFINKHSDELKLPGLCFDDVKYYDDSKGYSQRLAECLRQIDAEYILFFHDIDAVLYFTPGLPQQLLKLTIEHNIDRLDLYHRNFVHPDDDDCIKFNGSLNFVENVTKDTKYNVNPCIYKTSKFLELMSSIDATYRNVEELAQPFTAKEMKVYMAYSNFPVNCGWFGCDPSMIMLHLTHYGKMLPLWPQLNRCDKTVAKLYYELCRTYKFKKQFSLALYEHIAFQDPNYYQQVQHILRNQVTFE